MAIYIVKHIGSDGQNTVGVFIDEEDLAMKAWRGARLNDTGEDAIHLETWELGNHKTGQLLHVMCRDKDESWMWDPETARVWDVERKSA